MTTSSKPSVTLTVSKIRFLCEQSGPTETMLKERLSTVLDSSGLIRRAYLVRVAYEDQRGTAVSVSLALRTTTDRDEPSLVGPVGATFASIFGSHEHLDILFVREERERALRAVCPTFYEARAGSATLH
jgi:hypothetical protein